MSGEIVFDKSIIVLDDDDLVRMLVRKMLTSSGFSHVTLTEQPRDVLQKIEGGSIDLIICDWHMPKITGLEMFRSIRNIDPVVPFIMLTAERKKENVMDALEAGVKAYVTKPFSKQDLLEKVFDQLRHSTKR